MKYDIDVLKRKMLVKYPFFGSVVANVEYEENEEIETAETDGKVIYYNPLFLESLSIEEQLCIFAHEVCHIAFNHVLRGEGKEEETWNDAADAVTNALLKRDGLKLADGMVDIKDAINYDVEELYEKLLEGGKQPNKKDQNDNSPNGNSKKSAGPNNHSMWKDAVKKHKMDEGKKDDKTEIKKKQKECESLGERGAFKKNLEEKKRKLTELKEQITKQAGTTTNQSLRDVKEIGNAKPLIDWRYILRETIKYDVDWSYKNAYIEDGVVFANLEEQPMPETEIVLDTSGSIDETLLKNFLRECKNILKHSKLKVGCFDTKFYGFEEIRTEEDIENMKFVGGGGTNFDAAVNAFSRRVENKIIFTDGEACMPKKPLDAIWIVFGSEKINPKGGKVINITGEQLDKLYSFEIKGRSR